MSKDFVYIVAVVSTKEFFIFTDLKMCLASWSTTYSNLDGELVFNMANPNIIPVSYNGELVGTINAINIETIPQHF